MPPRGLPARSGACLRRCRPAGPARGRPWLSRRDCVRRSTSCWARGGGSCRSTGHCHLGGRGRTSCGTGTAPSRSRRGAERSAQWASQPTYSLSRCRATTARARPGRQRRMLPLRQPSRRAPAGRPLLPQCSLGGTRRCAGSGGAPRGPPRRTRGSCAAWRGWVALTPPRSSRMPLAGRRGHCCKCRRGRFTSSLRGRRMG
mmetsp:Transcript_64709/g.204298  ORF Transcript_64709/g.204298 Transcript_64709/m.204298 type:complete len:201 (-) Transcript_64709:562-1164(-)